jgi:luciferase family oxidoreductase group 1
MLPNHAPLVVAEQFGTLASLYPGRIDMGLGRAPGTDQLTARALRRHNQGGADFLHEIQELRTYLSPANKNSLVRAIPGEGLDIPLWILGSSTESAMLAAMLGFPYAFASHFAPTQFEEAIQLYRKNFRPSPDLDKPLVMAGINVIAAETDAEAQRLATTYYQLVRGIITGQRKPLQPPVPGFESQLQDYELAAIEQMATYAFIGNKEKIRSNLRAFVERTGVDELIVSSHIYDPAARKESYRLLMEALG